MDPIKQISTEESGYPKLLSQITDPPSKLYCRGNLDLLNSECFAVVGTRRLTSYGKEAAQKITAGLVQAGFTIVSGLAMGIDAVAHQATLDNGGKTIAVLGGGVDDNNIGPKINFGLSMNILKNNGLIISEYPEGFNPNERTFPQRNRIISGLSRGVLIIEAGEGSGALITAKCALDQNRDVFAVPGSIFSSKSLGPNDLIKKGAKLTTSVQDIIDDYGYNLKLLDSPVGGEKTTISVKNPVENNILAILEDKVEISADEIISYLPTENTSDILSSLSMLEISGLIKKTSNGKYSTSK